MLVAPSPHFLSELIHLVCPLHGVYSELERRLDLHYFLSVTHPLGFPSRGYSELERGRDLLLPSLLSLLGLGG